MLMLYIICLIVSLLCFWAMLLICMHGTRTHQDTFLECAAALFFGLFCAVCIIGILGEVL